jgi:hypothetical protein
MESKSEKASGAKRGETEPSVRADRPPDEQGDDRVIVIEQSRPEADQAYVDSYADLGRALARPDQLLDPDHPLEANQAFVVLLQRPEPIRPAVTTHTSTT